MMEVYKKLNKITSTIGSGEAITQFSKLQDNNDIQLILNINKEVQQANSYLNNIIVVQMRTNEMQRAIDRILNIAIYVNGEMSRSTHSVDGQQLHQVASSKIDELKNELNSSIASAYLFSGSMVNIPAIGDIEDVNGYYQGDDIIHSAKISDVMEIEYGVTGDNEAFQQIINSVNLAITAKADKQILHTAQVWMEKAIPSLINLQQKVRNDYAIATEYKQINEDTKLELGHLRDNIEESYGVNLPQLLAEFTLNESILKASQAMFSRLSDLNLAGKL